MHKRTRLPALVVTLLAANLLLASRVLTGQVQPDDGGGGGSYEGVCTTCLGPEEFDCCEIVACGGPNEPACDCTTWNCE